MKKLIIFLSLCLFSIGCATVHIFSASNPEVTLKLHKKILIIANVPGMEFQTQLEDGLSNRLQINSPVQKFFQRSHLIFQVTPLTTKNIEDLCEKFDCDAVIFIGVNPPTTKNYDINLGSNTRGSVTPSAFGGYSFTSVWKIPANIEYEYGEDKTWTPSRKLRSATRIAGRHRKANANDGARGIRHRLLSGTPESETAWSNGDPRSDRRCYCNLAWSVVNNRSQCTEARRTIPGSMSFRSLQA